MRIDNGNSRAEHSNSSRFERMAQREARQAERQERKDERRAERETPQSAPTTQPNLPNTPIDVIPPQEPTPIDPGFGNGPIPNFPFGPTGLDPTITDPVFIDPNLLDPQVPIDPGFGGGTILPPNFLRFPGDKWD